MKVGQGNAYLIADLHNRSLTTEEIRERWKRGDYGTPCVKLAKGWFEASDQKG
jgi:hypothetical protein